MGLLIGDHETERDLREERSSLVAEVKRLQRQNDQLHDTTYLLERERAKIERVRDVLKASSCECADKVMQPGPLCLRCKAFLAIA